MREIDRRTVFVGGGILTTTALVLTGTWINIFDEEGGVDPDPDDCLPLEVSSSTEKSALLTALAEKYNAAGRKIGKGKTCARVHVTPFSSGLAKTALEKGWSAETAQDKAEPQIWMPSSSVWLSLLKAAEAKTYGDVASVSVARSPMVIAGPGARGSALAKLASPGWGDILSTAGEVLPGAGAFRFVKDNPTASTSGLLATIATYYSTVDHSGILLEGDVTKTEANSLMRRIEANVDHYGEDLVELMAELSRHPTDSRIDAVVTQEAMVSQANRGQFPDSEAIGKNPDTRLTAVYPREGTLECDHPFIILPTAGPEQRAAAADFLAFLKEPAQQDSFAEFGFRSFDGSVAPAILKEVGAPDTARTVSNLQMPEAKVVNAVLDRWKALHKRANIIFLMDASGSMVQHRIDGGTRFDVAVDAATKAPGVTFFTADDRVALWSFSSGDGLKDYRQEIPLSAFDQKEWEIGLGGIKAVGDTPLYTAVGAAVGHLRRNYDEERVNAVIVLTDGVNDDEKNDDIHDLLTELTASDRPQVKVFGIAFAKNKDSAEDKKRIADLKSIAAATGGTAEEAPDAATVKEVLLRMFNRF
ncbi:substrate-binding and VWA domain-containing protein [Actinocorallia aurea]